MIFLFHCERMINIMNIAIIDDDLFFMNELKDIITERINQLNITNFAISTFSSPEQLLEEIHLFDLLFIDVEIKQYNGINICKQIRKSNTDILIILIKLTNHSDYADQLFRYP